MDLNNKTFGEIVVGIASQLSIYFITFIAGLAMIVFFWGVAKYIYKGDSEAERKKGKDLMFWGIIGFFVFFAVWAIVGVMTNTFGIENTIPQFKSQQTQTQTFDLPSMDTLKSSGKQTGNNIFNTPSGSPGVNSIVNTNQ
jgi:hypothetical protein